jgi:hypothetical protein
VKFLLLLPYQKQKWVDRIFVLRFPMSDARMEDPPSSRMPAGNFRIWAGSGHEKAEPTGTISMP